jgi:hypothetical protein
MPPLLFTIASFLLSPLSPTKPSLLQLIPRDQWRAHLGRRVGAGKSAPEARAMQYVPGAIFKGHALWCGQFLLYEWLAILRPLARRQKGINRHFLDYKASFLSCGALKL